VLGIIKLTKSLAPDYNAQIIGPESSNGIKGNRTWGFGQWAPVLLLFLPVFSMAEFLYGMLSKSSRLMFISGFSVA